MHECISTFKLLETLIISTSLSSLFSYNCNEESHNFTICSLPSGSFLFLPSFSSSVQFGERREAQHERRGLVSIAKETAWTSREASTWEWTEVLGIASYTSQASHPWLPDQALSSCRDSLLQIPPLYNSDIFPFLVPSQSRRPIGKEKPGMKEKGLSS